MSACNGCQLIDLKDKYGDKLIKIGDKGWYLLGEQPAEGQGLPAEYKGQPIRFVIRFMSEGHVNQHDQWVEIGSANEPYSTEFANRHKGSIRLQRGRSIQALRFRKESMSRKWVKFLKEKGLWNESMSVKEPVKTPRPDPLPTPLVPLTEKLAESILEASSIMHCEGLWVEDEAGWTTLLKLIGGTYPKLKKQYDYLPDLK